MAEQIELNDPGWAWAEYKPDAERPWNLARAGHLYRRAAFGASWEQLQQALSDGPQRTIDKLLRPQSDTAQFDHIYYEYEAATSSVDQLRAWWLRRMIQTPHPLLEKMTLFWHSHFATNAAEVKNAQLMRQHVRLLRNQALDSFRILLDGILQDPAVLLWLDAEANRKARPNKNFAQVILDDFTLGPDQYSEDDIQGISRALTGWFVLSGKLRYIPREHDGHEKHILGQKGNFTQEDVLRIILEQPATSRRLVRKMYSWFISETGQPDENIISPLADSFAKDYDVLKLIETMVRSNLFFSKMAYHRRIKSPVEFAIGIIKAMEGMVSTTQLANDLAGLGQNLYDPPTIKGWIGGKHWINSSAIVARLNLISALLRGSGSYGDKLNPWIVAERYGCTAAESARQFLFDLLLQGDLDSEVYNELLKSHEWSEDDLEESARSFTYSIITLPEFHLA